VLVVSHGNTLRALVKHLEAIPDDQIAGVDIPTGIPLLYELGPDLRPDALGGQYLDPHAARAAIEVIRNQGRPRVAEGQGYGDVSRGLRVVTQNPVPPCYRAVKPGSVLP